jgi:DNA-binding NarL/FixJ family response regulator
LKDEAVEFVLFPNNGAHAMNKKRVFIVDDHPMTRHGLRELINCEPDLSVCGEAGDAQRALQNINQPLPDLVLVDLTLSGKGGLDLIKDLHAIHPSLAMLVVSMHEESVYAERVLRSGARGYIMKTEGGEKLLQAIRKVLEGKLFVSEGMSESIIDVFANPASSKARTALAQLTDREFEVFQLLGQGLTTRQICQRLNLSIPTVGTHRMNIRRKLRLETGPQLVQTAVRWAAGQQLL